MKPTPEQSAVVNSDASLLLVNAFAGTGKTSTLVAYAKARPGKRILYIAFNKSIQESAASKFPSNVTCRTTHSLAYEAFGFRYQSKLGNLRPGDIMRAYKVPAMLAMHVVDTVMRFLHSVDEKVSLDHVPLAIPAESRDVFVEMAARVWVDMCDDKNANVRMPHDGYLKLYQLSRPNLAARFDIILFDECQDANPVTAGIVLGQSCVRVLVGDRHQSIYAFRHSVNAFEMAHGGEVYFLTQSFRFGPRVANIASVLLSAFRGERRKVQGSGVAETSRSMVDESRPFTLICRTNAELFRRAVEYVGSGRRVHFIGGIENLPFVKILDVYTIWSGNGGQVKDASLRAFRSFEQLEAYGRQAEDREILSLIGVVREYSHSIPGMIERLMAGSVPEEKAQITLVTAHRSKGLEFNQVRLAGDFGDLVDSRGMLKPMDTEEDVQEVNLLYVALTRAIQTLEINPQLSALLYAIAAVPAAAPAKAEDAQIAAVATGEDKAASFDSAFASSQLDLFAKPFVRSLAATAPCASEAAEPSPVTVADLQQPQAGLGLEVPVVPPADVLARRIERVILTLGLLNAKRISQELGEEVSFVAEKICRMILAGELSDRLFLACPEVKTRLKVLARG